MYEFISLCLALDNNEAGKVVQNEKFYRTVRACIFCSFYISGFLTVLSSCVMSVHIATYNLKERAIYFHGEMFGFILAMMRY